MCVAYANFYTFYEKVLGYNSCTNLENIREILLSFLFYWFWLFPAISIFKITNIMLSVSNVLACFS